VTDGDRLGELGDGPIEDRDVVGDGVGSGVARTEDPRQRLAGGIGEAEHRVEAEPALVGGGRLVLAVGMDLDQRGVDIEDDRVLPGGAEDRAQTFGRTSAMARAISARVELVISWKVRCTVEPEGTDPNQVGWSRRCSMSAQLSPPAASINAVCTSTFPRSWNGIRSPTGGMRDESESPSPNRSANHPRACSPTWATMSSPPDSTFTRCALVPFTLEVPFLLGNLVSRQQQFPLLGGLFRGRGPLRSGGLVNDQG